MGGLSILRGDVTPHALAAAIALGLACLALVATRLRHGAWILATAAVLLLAAVAACSPQFSLVGWHGYMHAAPIYRLVDGGPLPPEDPLFAGGALRYPWVEHWLVAAVCGATGWNAHVFLLAGEIALFAGLLAAGAWLARAVTGDRATVTLSLLLTGFGVSVFHGGPLQDFLLQMAPGLSMETRVVPIDKFANISGMPGGYVAMVAGSAAGLRLASGAGRVATMTAVVAGSTLMAALLHPLSWAGIVTFQGAMVLVLAWRRDPGFQQRSTAIAAAVAIPSLMALPYLAAIGQSESSDGWSGLTSSAWLLRVKLEDLALFLAALFGLRLAWARLGNREDDTEERAATMLKAVVAAMALAYLLVRFPGRNEYKFLLYAAPAAAILMARALADLSRSSRFLAGLLLFLLLLPGSHDLAIRPWFRVTEPARADGVWLRAVDAETDALYGWIASQTPPDAVFLAADLLVPPLGRRSLYIAVDARWRGPDGWGLARDQLLQWHVRRPDRAMYRRQHLATLVLDANWSIQSAADVLAAIREDVPGRPLFVLSRNPSADDRLEESGQFELLFRNRRGAVYRAATGAAR